MPTTTTKKNGCGYSSRFFKTTEELNNIFCFKMKLPFDLSIFV